MEMTYSYCTITVLKFTSITRFLTAIHNYVKYICYYYTSTLIINQKYYHLYAFKFFYKFNVLRLSKEYKFYLNYIYNVILILTNRQHLSQLEKVMQKYTCSGK